MKKILVLNFFPAFTPPKSGGEQRYFYIYEELSKFFDITLLSPTHPNTSVEVVKHSNTYREYRVPKETMHIKLHAILNKENVGSEVSGIVNGLCAKFPSEYHNIYNELYKDAEIIIHDNPYMLGYDLFFGIDNKPRIYNSYNHESILLKQTLTGIYAEQFINYIENMERTLMENSDLLFVTSLEEKKSFISNYQINENKIKLAPNGIHPSQWAPRNNSEDLTTAFFIGSAHPPNIEAVEFIINDLSEKCKNVNFIIAGKCTESFQHIRKSNVTIMGLIDEKTKLELFSSANFAINPMFHGAGTNLKTLEYLSAGLPLISTEIGARGLELIDGVHYIRASKENFAGIIMNAVDNPNQLQQIAISGQKYINTKYSWKSIALNMRDEIKRLDKKNDKTIYLLNDFEASHPKSGGEVRINELYRALSKKYKIALLCLNNSNEINKIQITDSFFQLSIPKNMEHKQEDYLMNLKYPVSTADIIASYMSPKNILLKKVHQNFFALADVIILVHPYMSKLLENLDGKPIIYESLNAELELKKHLLKGHPEYERLINQVKTVEEMACKKSEFIISVSESDHSFLLNYLKEETKDIITINNGVRILDVPPFQKKAVNKTGTPKVVFIGSGHPPNVEALQFIIELAPLVKAEFIIIGSVCNPYINQKLHSNIKLLGEIDINKKMSVMQGSDIAINPMRSGSGSNVKIADYFSNRLPTITTPIGARGYNIKNGEHAIICHLSDFRSAINHLISKPLLQETLAQNAFNYAVQELDWGKLAEKFDSELQKRIFINKHD